jgi:hypothetical protein
MTTLRAVVRDRRIEVPAPADLPDGSEVVLSINTDPDAGSVTKDEIARVLAAMFALEPLDIPPEISADLEAWEQRLNRHGIENAETGIGDTFR